MLIWSGLGFLVPAITFGVCLLLNFVLDAKFGEGFYSTHLWAPGAALVIGGLISAFVGVVLRSPHDRDVIDARTGEHLTINRSHHTFFFIPMHWAGVVVALIGFAVEVYGAMK